MRLHLLADNSRDNRRAFTLPPDYITTHRIWGLPDYFCIDFLQPPPKKKLPKLPHCSVAAVLQGIMGKTDRRRVCLARHRRSCLCRLLARARALFFNFFSRNGNISMATGHRATIPPGMHGARLIHQ